MTATLKAWPSGTPWYSVCPAAMRAVVALAVGLMPVKIRDATERSGANRSGSYTCRPCFCVARVFRAIE